MLQIELIDDKGDFWTLQWANAAVPYLHKGEKYWKAWWRALERPEELKNYPEVPLPIFTEWWPHRWGIDTGFGVLPHERRTTD